MNNKINANAKAKIQKMLAGNPENNLTVVYCYETEGTLYSRPYAELREISVWLDEDGELRWKDKKLHESPDPDLLKRRYNGNYKFISYNKMSYLFQNEIYSRVLDFLKTA